MRRIEREADDFGEEAVEELIKKQRGGSGLAEGGCPSAQPQVFGGQSPCQAANQPSGNAGASQSALAHWPVQIRLVPPTAAFLKNSDLLVAADCTAVAYPDFHRKFLQGKAVMMGCPKFDDQDGYVKKFKEVFETADLKSITMLIMEVPCCGTMRGIIAEALKQSGKDIEVNEAVISVSGELLGRSPLKRF